MKTFVSNLGRRSLSVGVAALALVAGSANVARADVIPYPTPGTPNNTVYTFTATTTGNITAYFAGSDAGATSTIGMLVNGVSSGITGLQNHTSTVGQSLILGSVNAGDVITFELFVRTPDNLTAVGTIFSNPALNGPYDSLTGPVVPGHNHIFSTPYTRTANISGPPANIPLSANIPVGTYVSFEDLPIPGGFPPQNILDYDYNDETFIFANVSTSRVPDAASSLGLLSIGFVGLGLLRRRLGA